MKELAILKKCLCFALFEKSGVADYGVVDGQPPERAPKGGSGKLRGVYAEDLGIDDERAGSELGFGQRLRLIMRKALE